MISTVNLDLDVLRTLVVAQRLGSFSQAAEFVGRSQSAVSQQVRKIEDQLGLPLFRKQGRGLAPTEAGEVVLSTDPKLPTGTPVKAGDRLTLRRQSVVVLRET